MSIPVIPEHKKTPNCDKCQYFVKKEGLCLAETGIVCQRICVPDCPACAVEANNKAWAKYLVVHFSRYANDLVLVDIPASDWEQIKKLAEEKTK